MQPGQKQTVLYCTYIQTYVNIYIGRSTASQALKTKALTSLLENEINLILGVRTGHTQTILQYILYS